MREGEHSEFLCDVMLGKLSRWLRLLGYDTEYFRNGDDAFLFERACRSGRTLLTRDTGLHRRLPRQSVLVSSDRVEGQLRQLGDAGMIEFRGLQLTRCPACNGPLKPAGPSEVEGLVPGHVFQRQESFALCPLCNRVYWKGSHLRGIQEKISSAMSR